LVANTRLIEQSAREAGGKLQAIVGDCGNSNFRHHEELQKSVHRDSENAVLPLFDIGHLIRNILAPLRKGHEYVRDGFLSLLRMIELTMKILGIKFSLQLIQQNIGPWGIFPSLR
jgi:hypothetical protein